MSVRYWANQHGTGVVLDGEHYDFISEAARKRNCTPEEAFNQIIREHCERILEREATE